MANYEITWTVPYEGGSSESFGSPEEVLAWLDANRSRYDYSLDNVTLRGPVGEIDLYGLLERREAGLPLLDPDEAACTNDLLAVLHAVRRGKVDEATLEGLDRVRAIVSRLIEERAAVDASSPRP